MTGAINQLEHRVGADHTAQHGRDLLDQRVDAFRIRTPGHVRLIRHVDRLTQTVGAMRRPIRDDRRQRQFTGPVAVFAAGDLREHLHSRLHPVRAHPVGDATQRVEDPVRIRTVQPYNRAVAFAHEPGEIIRIGFRVQKHDGNMRPILRHMRCVRDHARMLDAVLGGVRVGQLRQLGRDVQQHAGLA